MRVAAPTKLRRRTSGAERLRVGETDSREEGQDDQGAGDRETRSWRLGSSARQLDPISEALDYSLAAECRSGNPSIRDPLSPVWPAPPEETS